jgi:hypothetical protein
MVLFMRKSSFFFCVSLVILLFSCAKDQTGTPTNQQPTNTSFRVTALSINLPEFVLFPGASQQLTVGFTPANTMDKKLTWASSNSSVATVDVNGLVTAVAAGTITITATSVDQPSVKVSSTLTVLKNYEVHVVGNGASQRYLNCALYWKNGVSSELPGGYTVGENAFAVTSSGDDIYIAGTTVNSNLWRIATYWKNGVAVQVSDPQAQNDTYARSIAVSRSSVYVVGYSFINTECPDYCLGRFRASYWIDNGSTIKYYPLYNTIASTQAFSVALSGNDVIIAGSRANNNFERWGAYWKNDFINETPLSSGYNHYQAQAVAVNGSDVYIAGYGGCPDIGCIKSAKLWKNSITNMVTLTSGSTEAQAAAIALSNEIAYVCGYEKNSQGKYIARYWKIEGNNVSSYALTDGTYDAMAKAITVTGEDIFVAGFETDNSGKKVAKYWRAYKGMSWVTNLKSSQLYGQRDSEANGIFVK